MPRGESKAHFLWRNLLPGLLWFAFLIIVYIFLEEYLRENFGHYIESVQSKPAIVFGTFALSEIIFGIIPPEFFMMLSILNGISVEGFAINLAIYATVSYLAGVLGYYIGKTFSRTRLYQRLQAKYFDQYEMKLKVYGSYLVVVGAVTPIPFSATCMLAGSVKLPFKTFLLVSTARILRFGVYGWMVWNFPNWFGI